MKCSTCGSTALVEGSVMDTGAGGGLGFQAADVSSLKKMFGAGIRRIVAYGCIHCQRLQLAVSFSEEDVQRYQQFEGEQPGVLERINSEPREVEK